MLTQTSYYSTPLSGLYFAPSSFPLIPPPLSYACILVFFPHYNVLLCFFSPLIIHLYCLKSASSFTVYSFLILQLLPPSLSILLNHSLRLSLHLPLDSNPTPPPISGWLARFLSTSNSWRWIPLSPGTAGKTKPGLDCLTVSRQESLYALTFTRTTECSDGSSGRGLVLAWKYCRELKGIINESEEIYKIIAGE